MEEAGAYERWFHITVQASLGDPHPNISHDHMLADTEAIIRAAGQERSALYIVHTPAASHVQTWRDGITLDYCVLNATLNQRR